MEKVLRIDRQNPDLSLLQKAANLIHQGEIVAFPTETFYGLGADALNGDAVERLYLMKERAQDRPVLILVRDASRIAPLVTEISDPARSLMDRFWPGPLTLVFHASKSLPRALTGGTGKIGIRVPGDELTLLFLKTVETPVTATSANRSGQASPITASAVLEGLGDHSPWILDGGPTPGGLPSSVVDVTVDPFMVIREGRIAADHIHTQIGL